MPIRVMVEDAAGYDEQMRRIRREHRRAGGLEGAEFLSGFSREDRIHPVFTIVLYYGKEPWDGARDLHSLMAVSYTHLDVYKRQMRFSVIRKPIGSMGQPQSDF